VAGTSIVGDSFPEGSLPVLEERDIAFALVGEGSLVWAAGEPAPGVYPLAGSSVSAVVIDEDASGLLASADGVDALLDHVFALTLAESPPRAVVALVEVGPGTASDIDALSTVVEAAVTADWIDMTTCAAIASAPDGDESTLAPRADPGRAAPTGYWADVDAARRSAKGLHAAAGELDVDAEAAMYDLLVAESRCWAGPDESWSLADRGRAFAAAALRHGETVLSAITMASEDITFAGRSGKIPVSIENGNEKSLQVVVRATPERARTSVTRETTVTLRPADNYLEIPVSLDSALSDRVSIEVLAGDYVVSGTTVTVGASYLDRLAIVALIVLVLAGLLFYIRRRVSLAEQPEAGPRRRGRSSRRNR
jgi:hypothetical protein